MEPSNEPITDKCELKERKNLREEKIRCFEWTSEMEAEYQKILAEDQNKKSDFIYKKYEDQAKRYWDVFYKSNTTNFFKDRHYLHEEFQELGRALESEESKERVQTLFEIGCGVGNAFFPLVEKYQNIKVFGVDISPKAIELIQKHEKYDPLRIQVRSMDIVKEDFKAFPGAPIDFGTLIYVLSAISPENYSQVIKKIYSTMAENGILYFRDYGR
jgi:methyltransferase-like protein 6